MIDWLRRNRGEQPEAPPPAIELAGRSVPIILKRTAQAKRLTMRLSPNGQEIRITLPRWALRAEALDFVHSRRGWLEAQLAKVPQRQPVLPGAEISYRGQGLLLHWHERAPRKPQLDGERLVLGGPVDNLSSRIARWLEGEARRLFERDLEEYCQRAGQSLPRLHISRAQRRWGSCAGDGTIRLNWRLVQAPDPIRRSVVAHEVTHLVHFDHSPRFHAMLGDLFEGDIKAADRWLKTHGRSLYSQFG